MKTTLDTRTIHIKPMMPLVREDLRHELMHTTKDLLAFVAMLTFVVAVGVVAVMLATPQPMPV